MKMDDLKSRMKIGRNIIIISLSLCALIAFHGFTKLAVAFYYSSEWPKARGNVIKSYVDVTTPSGEGYYNYMPKVVYVYSVDGVDYEGNRIFFLEDGRGSSWSYKKVEKYKIEQQIEVFYNPQDPSISVLEPGGSILGILLSGGIHFMGIGVLLFLASALIWDYRKTNKTMITMKTGSHYLRTRHVWNENRVSNFD